jgi:hypothetical protein
MSAIARRSVEEAVAGEMADDLALLAIDHHHKDVDADRRSPTSRSACIEVPDELAGVDVGATAALV